MDDNMDKNYFINNGQDEDRIGLIFSNIVKKYFKGRILDSDAEPDIFKEIFRG
jgi:hypothetical protein